MAENNTTLLVVGVLILVIITAGLTYYIAKSSSATFTPTINQSSNQTGQIAKITVHGEASKTFKSDLLSIGITIKSSALNTSQSQAQNVNDTSKVKAALLVAGLNESEIQTSSYYTSPIYNNSNQYYYYCDSYAYDSSIVGASEGSTSPSYVGDSYYPNPDRSRCKIIGYRTTHVLLIKTNKTNDGEKFVQSALNASNTTEIDYIYFSLGEATRIAAESELQASAAATAKTKAENIAKGLGAKLGKIVSASPNSYYPYYTTYAYNKAANSEDSISTPPSQISPTDTTLSSYMTVVYELQQ